MSHRIAPDIIQLLFTLVKLCTKFYSKFRGVVNASLILEKNGIDRDAAKGKDSVKMCKIYPTL